MPAALLQRFSYISQMHSYSLRAFLRPLIARRFGARGDLILPRGCAIFSIPIFHSIRSTRVPFSLFAISNKVVYWYVCVCRRPQKVTQPQTVCKQ